MAMEDFLSKGRILQIAIELEVTGGVFYEVVASGCGRGNERVAKLFLRMIDEEEDHRKTFENMLNEFVEQTGQRPAPLSPEEREYVTKLLNAQVLPDPVATREKAEHCILKEAVDIAIEMERETVAFYAGVLLTATGEDDAKLVQKIIDEEKKHERDVLDLARTEVT
jgi:rubrerythrin